MLLLVGVAGALMAGLAVQDGSAGDRSGPALVASTAPSSIYQGETVTMYGGLVLPAGTFEVGSFSCQSGTCRRSLWRSVTGPGEFWGSLGSVRFDESGDATVELRVFEADAVTDRVLGVWRREVDVLPVADPTSAHANGYALLVRTR